MRGLRKLGTLGAVALFTSSFLWGCGTQQTNLTSKFMKVDAASKTVTLNLIAAYTPNNNYNNYNGYSYGHMVISIPQGYTVKVKYANNGGIPADVGVYTMNDQLAFHGAGDSITEIYVNAMAGIQPGQAEKFSFVANKTGTYKIANYMNRFPYLGQNAYQDLGMWDVLKVVNGGSPSITTA